MRRRDVLLGCTSTTLVGLTPIRSSARESSSGHLNASTRGLVRPKLSLSTNFGAPAHAGAGTRPDVVGVAKISNPTLTHWFNTAAFADPAQYTIGNAGRNILIGPGSSNWDIIISKWFHIGERHRIQFRSEFFNAFNHPTFNNPGATLGVPSFGVITSANPGRIIQFGLKYMFRPPRKMVDCTWGGPVAAPVFRRAENVSFR